MAIAISKAGEQLDANEAFKKWKADPHGSILDTAGSDPKLISLLETRLSDLDRAIVAETWGCWLCKKAVEKTLELTLGVALVGIVGLVVGSDGADVPAVPAEVELAESTAAGAVALEAGVEVDEATALLGETVNNGLRWIVANKAKAVALWLGGELIGDVFISPAAERLCNVGGHCPN